MKLSEAMRIGARKRQQAFGTLFDGKGTCALGAALDGVSGRELLYQFDLCVAAQTWSILDMPAINPVTGHDESMHTIIFCLNDDCRWTRQQIADWVATVERQRQTEAKATPAKPIEDEERELVLV